MPVGLIKKLTDFLGPSWQVLTVEPGGFFDEAWAVLEAEFKLAEGPTVWLRPDTFPADLRGRNDLVAADGFKAVLAVQAFHPEISYATVLEEGRAITVFWPAAPHPDRAPVFDSLAGIAALKPFSLTRWAHLLLPVSEGALYHLIGHGLNPALKPPLADGNWESLFTEREEGGVAPGLRPLVQKEVLAAMEGYKRELTALKEELALLRSRLR